MARCFVAGATGFTGRAVVQQLCEAGEVVVAHIRPGSSSLERYGPGFEALGAEVDTTPWSLPELRARLIALEPTHVFCLIGTTGARMKALEREGKQAAAASYDAVDYGLTAMLVEASEAVPVRPRFVYLSSMGVGPRALNAYMAARWRAEEAVRHATLPFTIIRPGLITGPNREDDRPAERITGALMGGVFGAARKLGLARLADQYTPTDDAELAAGIIRHALNPTSPSDIIEQHQLRA